MLATNLLFDPRHDDIVPVGYKPREYKLIFTIEETEARKYEYINVHSDTHTKIRPRKYKSGYSRGRVSPLSRQGNPELLIQRGEASRKRRLDNVRTKEFVLASFNGA